jgi:hypothetical protein
MVSERKWTPGPWHLSDETIRDGLWSKLLYGQPEGMLAIIRVGHQGGYYGDANARLISAAPDLYEALSAMIREIGEARSHGSSAIDLISSSAIEMARAALSKARGELA